MKNSEGNYILKLVLTNFFGASIKSIENENGDMEECVCIPLDRNNLKKNKRNQVTAYSFMTKTMTANMYGWTHYLKMKVDPNFLKKINEQGFRCPYLGNARDSNYIVYKNEYKQNFVKVDNDE